MMMSEDEFFSQITSMVFEFFYHHHILEIIVLRIFHNVSLHKKMENGTVPLVSWCILASHLTI